MSKNYVKQALRGIRFQVVSISKSLDDCRFLRDKRTQLQEMHESVKSCLERIAELEKALEAEG